MDTQQLKLLAGQVRGLLQQSNQQVGHSQALDAIAAVPGLRNWPEVVAFPDHVAACHLDLASANRLAFRLKRKFQFEMSPQALLAALMPPERVKASLVPQIWPSGPRPGVYVTTSEVAIRALVQRYDEATDGALGYAEDAASGWEGAIRLGDHGLWSDGMARVPSGTLIVVGPLRLDQESWRGSADRLDMACLDASLCDHRVAILVQTPTPDFVCEDLMLMQKSIQPDDVDAQDMLMGVITDDGEMQPRTPFARERPLPKVSPTIASTDALPPSVLERLKAALLRHRTGLVVFGTDRVDKEHYGIDLVASALALTEHVGPAARIMPRHRGTPAKDWMVPEPIKQLPYLPSIESAVAQGYRRLVIDPIYTNTDAFLEFGNDVMLLANIYDGSVERAFMSAIRPGHPENYNALLPMLVAVLAVKEFEIEQRSFVVSDLYVRGDLPVPSIARFEEFKQFLSEQRVIRWQDEMALLMDRGAPSEADLKTLFPREDGLQQFIAGRRKSAEKSEEAPI